MGEEVTRGGGHHGSALPRDTTSVSLSEPPLWGCPAGGSSHPAVLPAPLASLAPGQCPSQASVTPLLWVPRPQVWLVAECRLGT